MTLEERLRALYDILPDGGGVFLDRPALGGLLGLATVASEERRSRDLTTDEMAELFKKSRGTILRWLHEGVFGDEGEGWYRLGRRYYIRPLADSSLLPRRRSSESLLRLPRKG